MLSPYQRYRLYEILPGLSVWLTLVAAIVLSFVEPIWMIYAILIFDIYWVLKVIYFSFYLCVAWSRYRAVQRTDWDKLLQNCGRPWQELKHVIFLTVLNEEWDVVKTAIESIARSAYDPRRFVLVIAGEERTRAHYEQILQETKKIFRGAFGDIVGTLHPKDLPDEIPGKGSNLHFAEQEIKKYLDQRGWKYSRVIATIFDIDTITHPAYFRYLTYLYATHPRPTHSSFQPVALYNNNIWESPAILRTMAFGTTFWLLNALARQDALVTFSSHSMSFQAIVDAGYHDKRIVSEDSRIFYQCLIRYQGDYEVTPMYVPVSMDTVRDDRFWQSIKNLYRQQRRWAWGVEHVPYLLWEFQEKGKNIPWYTKVKWIFVEWEGKWSWCLVALLILILGRLPMWVAPESVRQSALFFNAPHILETLMNVAMIGLFLSAILSFPLLPRRPKTHPKYTYIFLVLQWLLVPFTLILMSSIPAIDAVTHLMFGRYLGFNISQKRRKGDVIPLPQTILSP